MLRDGKHSSCLTVPIHQLATGTQKHWAAGWPQRKRPGIQGQSLRGVSQRGGWSPGRRGPACTCNAVPQGWVQNTGQQLFHSGSSGKENLSTTLNYWSWTQGTFQLQRSSLFLSALEGEDGTSAMAGSAPVSTIFLTPNSQAPGLLVHRLSVF